MRNCFHKTAEFQDILPRLTVEKEAKKMVIFAIVCFHGNSLQYTYTKKKWNPRCVANLRCECQELKPKVEAYGSFLVLHPCSGVGTVKTVGSHLKTNICTRSEASRANMVVVRTSNFQGATIKPIVPRH